MYRQTILFSSFEAPELNALTKELRNHEGLINLTGDAVGMINEIIPQVLHLPCSELQVLHGPSLTHTVCTAALHRLCTRLIVYIVCSVSKLPSMNQQGGPVCCALVMRVCEELPKMQCSTNDF
jgi:hypothetical protein